MDLAEIARRRLRRLAASTVLVGALALPAASAVAADSAVVVMYHRFGEGAYPSTNVSLDQLEAHIAELKSGAYAVLPLPEIVDALAAKRPLPDRTVGISIDDAYLSVYREAWPRFRAAKLPFTLFVAIDPIDGKTAGYMSWDQLRELKADGVVIGSQTASHPHMAGAPADANRADIERSNARFAAELGEAPTLFAYPYGEASTAVAALVRELGFRAAFGQHSGVLWSGEDRYYLPRFAFNEAFGSLARFRQAANALALPVADVTPADPLIAAGNPPAIGFTVLEGVGGLDRLACYMSSEGRTTTERLGGTRVEIRLSAALPAGRSRLNCTMPAGDGRWRWYGRQYYVPRSAASALR